MIAGVSNNFFRCPDDLVKHGDYSRTSLIICRTSDSWWRCTGDAQIRASRKHVEALATGCLDSLVENKFS